MKLLLDACVWGGAKADLLSAGHDVRWIGDLPVDPGDEEVLSTAKIEERILVTLDKDFGELVFLRGMAHTGIVRLVEIPSRLQGKQILTALELYGSELIRGAIVTLNLDRVRVRRPIGKA